jgi:branched-chain amino acid transport system ATP-binding protein
MHFLADDVSPPINSSPLLQVEGLVTGYGDRPAVNGVDFSVNRSEVVAIIGHNGAGKSSLLRALVGLLPMWRGTYHLYGQVTSPDPRRLRSSGLGFMPQGRSVFTELTVEENLRVAASTIAGRAQRNGAQELILSSFPSLRELRRKVAGDLSGGQRQLLGLCLAMIGSPQVLLLDEPSIGLDSAAVRVVMSELVRIRERSGTSIVVVEHRVREVLRVADRVYVLRRGLTSFVGPASDLLESARLNSVYL